MNAIKKENKIPEFDKEIKKEVAKVKKEAKKEIEEAKKEVEEVKKEAESAKEIEHLKHELDETNKVIKEANKRIKDLDTQNTDYKNLIVEQVARAAKEISHRNSAFIVALITLFFSVACWAFCFYLMLGK